MPYFQMWREAWQDVDRAFKRMEHLSKMLNIASTQMIPKVHDRLAVVGRKIKKFDPMLEQWENGGLVKQTVIEKVVEKIVEVPVAGDAKTPQRKKQKPHKVVDYEMYQQVQQLTAEGLGISRIGKVLGISKQTVSDTRKMPPERVEHLRRVHEGLPSIYQSSGKRSATLLSKEEIQKILNVLEHTPDISRARLSLLTGISEYRITKYFTMSDAERVALLEAVGIDVSVGMSVDTTPRRRGRKPRGTYIPSDALPDVHGEDDDG
ncbi:helix-turn-helix domain-containing protein [Escherichia coli]|uniref:helix-turn-helix domain-containing protein n=1 Tax=Escherichia coli TaxID=562 RepID=UPI001061D06A|nr:helix-turn-helix domain-containing protein [Escherichia coli]VEW03640.1 conserved hypothetical protein [Escherichia coli]